MRTLSVITLLLGLITSSVLSEEVNVFSARHYDSDIQLYEKFTKATGIKVNVVSGKDAALQKRIIEEGKDCIGDLYITADAGRLGSFQAKGMLHKAQWSKEILDKYKKVTYKRNVLDLIKNSDLIIIHTEWNEFKQLNFKKMIKKRTNIYDLRNLYSPTEMKKNKINYFGIGR